MNSNSMKNAFQYPSFGNGNVAILYILGTLNEKGGNRGKPQIKPRFDFF